MINRRMVLLGVVLVGALPIVGCGEDDDGSESATARERVSLTTSSQSRPEFVKQATVVCRREKAGRIAKVGRFMQKLTAEGVPQEVQTARAIKAIMLPIAEAQIAGIIRLGAPAGDEAELEAALVAQQQAIEEIRETDRIGPNESPYDYFADATRRLRAYGLGPCQFG